MEITKENLKKYSNEYRKFKDQQETKTNEFSKQYIFYIIASSKNEFQKELDKLDVQLDDVASIGAGAYCKKKDYEKVNKFLDDIVDEKYAFINSSSDNFYGALYYELWNNEYYLNADNKLLSSLLGVDEQDILVKYPCANEVVNIYTREFEKLNI